MKKVNCIYCGLEVHPMRLEALPQTRTCVACSKEGKKAGRLVSYGSGEDVEVKLEILPSETYRKIRETEIAITQFGAPSQASNFLEELEEDEEEESTEVQELLKFTNRQELKEDVD